MQFRLHAFNFPDAPPQALKLFVNGREHGPQTVEGGWHTMEFLVEESVWRAGVNRIRLDFARANRPADVGLGGDPRMLAAALDFFKWSLERGSPAAARLGYVPLPSTLIDQVRAYWARAFKIRT